MTIGDGIAVAGCAASSAYVLRWFVHGLRLVRVAKAISEGVDKISAAVVKSK